MIREKDFRMALHPETISSSRVCDITVENIVYVAELIKAMELQGTEVTSLKMVWGEWNMWPACEPHLLQYVWKPSGGWYDLLNCVWRTLGTRRLKLGLLCLNNPAQTWNLLFLLSCSFFFKLEKKLGSLRLGSLTSVPGENMEHVLLEFISRYVNGKKAISSTQHSFSKGKCSLTKLVKWPSSEGEECGGRSDCLAQSWI